MSPQTAAWIATVGGLGRARPAPGTLASLAALAPAAVLLHHLGPLALILLIAMTFGLATHAVGSHASALGQQDPSEIVIDEVIGQWIALIVTPPTPLGFALAFCLFRAFDIAKPGPVGWADREVKGGIGIMLDDVVAGAMAGLIMFALAHLVPALSKTPA